MNIHGLGDRRDDEPQNGNRQPFFGNQGNDQTSAFLLGNQNQGDPREESFVKMLKVNFCPTATMKSFTILLMICLLICYIIQMCVDGINLQGELLEVKIDGALTSHLMIDTRTPTTKKEIWRYFTCLLLTPNLNTIISFCIIIIFFISFFERFMGMTQTALIFICSSLLINFFIGVVSSVDTYMGCMGGVFGIFGSGVSYLCINYSRMDSSPNLRYIFSCNLIFVVIIGKSD
jgi:membrane associated rhomboid family serine protease